MSFFRGCDLVNTFKVIKKKQFNILNTVQHHLIIETFKVIGFILQIHMHFDVCSVLTSNQKQLQLEVEQNDPIYESVCMSLRLSFDEY